MDTESRRLARAYLRAGYRYHDIIYHLTHSGVPLFLAREEVDRMLSTYLKEAMGWFIFSAHRLSHWH